MKTFQVSLSKSYLINIVAENEENAKRLAEFYTSDIRDISTESEHITEKFSIREIECQTNDAFDCKEIENE
ncbi:hypothetical protein BH18ACI1_BH18ACI1_11160 [soil metagenome]